MKLFTYLTNLLSSYAIFDIVFFIAIAFSCIYGYIKGFVRQLFGLVGIFIGTYCAYKLAGALTIWWHGHFDVDPRVTKIIIFIILSAIIYFLVLRLAILFDKLLKMAMLNWVNKFLGLIFGAAKIILIFSALAYAINSLNMSDKMNTSKIYSHLISLADFIFPYINFMS